MTPPASPDPQVHGGAQGRPPVMTLANKVTIARILLIPCFVVEILYYRQTAADWHRWIALGLFVTAAASDGIDGWIARRFNQRSRLGAVLDPLADKLLIVSALILLSRGGVPHLTPLPLWLVATVLSRDALLVLGLAVLHFTCGTAEVRPRLIGKASTVLQMAVIILALLDTRGPWLLWTSAAAAATAALSCAIYLRDGLRQLARSPHSAPL